MKWFYYLAIFYWGAILGSFLNVVIYRIPRHLSLWKPRSHCPHCGQYLQLRDNLPLISYLLLKGRCRFCHQKISSRYFKVEMLSGLIWTGVIAINGFNLVTFAWIVLLEGLLTLAWIDQRWGIVPDSIVLSLFIIGILLFLLAEPTFLIQRGASVAISTGFILLMALLGRLLFKREAIGGGDLKIAAVVGLFLGSKLSILSLCLAFTLGGIYGGILLLRKKIKPGTTLPWVPFLFVAVILAVLIGNRFFDWYLQLLEVQ
jgi:leader peptidase (prepilin peptidase)/N-methyltransferase